MPVLAPPWYMKCRFCGARAEHYETACAQ
jgi:hypothetical protein